MKERAARFMVGVENQYIDPPWLPWAVVAAIIAGVAWWVWRGFQLDRRGQPSLTHSPS